ncbi:MAG TPA: SHOCT domain-containing protein [Phycisphaerae bacterium]|nr:SHOCT domain-containing protein [Phycisphaerae bacterium]
MRAVTILVAVGMVAGALACGGCIAAADNDTVHYGMPTLGQELTDLSKAREAGAVTEQEYQDLRQKLLSCDGRTCGHKCGHGGN